MNRLRRIEEIWVCLLGKKSHINLLGKIVLFPVIVFIGIILSILELLFSKQEQNISGDDK